MPKERVVGGGAGRSRSRSSRSRRTLGRSNGNINGGKPGGRRWLGFVVWEGTRVDRVFLKLRGAG